MLFYSTTAITTTLEQPNSDSKRVFQTITLSTESDTKSGKFLIHMRRNTKLKQNLFCYPKRFLHNC